MNWFRFASPASFFPLAGRLAPWFGIAAAVFAAAGLYLGLVAAPTDAQQGDAYRIIFVHVATAWMSMFIYLVIAFWCAVSLMFNARLAAMMAQALAPDRCAVHGPGAGTGALWGKPTWGTYWAWDARMTSELILLFLYFGYMALRNAIDDPRRADRASALLALVGAVNVPIIYFSVKWWNTLHQGASVSLTSAPTMAAVMLAGMLADGAGRMVLFDRHRADPGARDHPRTRASRRLGGRGRARRQGRAMTLGEFLAMGGYGFYVWGSYAACALAVAAEIVTVRARLATARRAAGDMETLQ